MQYVHPTSIFISRLRVADNLEERLNGVEQCPRLRPGIQRDEASCYNIPDGASWGRERTGSSDNFHQSSLDICLLCLESRLQKNMYTIHGRIN